MTSSSSKIERPLSKVRSDIAKLMLAAAGVQGVALIALPVLQRSFYGPEAFADFAIYSQLAGLIGAISTGRMDLAIVQHQKAPLARAAFIHGSKLLLAASLAAFVLAHALNWGDFQMGQVHGLQVWLPLGVASMGLSAMCTAWMSRDSAFSKIAQYRAAGGISGEGMRFAAASLSHTGLIAGRIAGQWLTSLLALRKVIQDHSGWPRASAEDQKSAWKLDRDYVRFTTPANILAMAANALLILFLYEAAPRDFVGQVGTALAYLTAASGLVIKNVNDVFFRHLKEVANQHLSSLYGRWSISLMAVSAAGVACLHAIPGNWVTLALGERWADMLPAMQWLSLWMVPWIAGSSLSGIFPHLRRQSLAFVLDLGHLILIAGWLGLRWIDVPASSLGTDMRILQEYACIQGGFYSFTLIVGWYLCQKAKSTSAVD